MPEIKPDHHANETLKAESNFLRGTLKEGLVDDVTGALSDDDIQLTKFHGFYQQDDRELRAERKRQKLEPRYQFMIRLRLPGGVLTPAQWLVLDEVCGKYGNATMRVTTRQTFQFHQIFKESIKPMLQEINAAGLDSRGGCGDDNRNVIANTNPHRSELHKTVHQWARSLSNHLLWKSRAYDELWLDAEPTGEPEEEPLYGATYLPRKFKIGIALPPENDCDVFGNDLGLIAILGDDGELAGFNVAPGGGMGATYGDPRTYPRLGTVIGFCPVDKVYPLVESVIAAQRDHGDRVDRMQARLKYTIDRNGIDWFKAEVERRAGFALEPARDFAFTNNGDRYGWVEGEDGNQHLTIFIENGRVADWDGYQLRTGLRELAALNVGEIRMTCNQNLILANVPPDQRPAVEEIVTRYGIDDGTRNSMLRRSSMACVAFPTCGLAMAESERYLPGLITKLDAIMADAGLEDDSIVLRMTGCPNGCARPYLGEIGLTGKAPGKYNLYLGASHNGDRLNKLYRENIGEDIILAELTPIIHRYAAERDAGESFGDFVIRVGIIKATTEGRLFHEDVGPAAT